ncbi:MULTISPECIES: MBL fold metallo-hydrolase [unclassified Arthrobacter]|uniref:MBL fold metallo-hydrolase n=1 Tax=unclassified Arthrobacter TaxID=235627 RepID=UPI00159D1937|nr:MULTISPECIES: MBL fold metallo-hydrolase [unclassified Arthrobacter]MCQ9165588.1 MBL fold metallo-hydrolase [Arthrobacter sp. STN4]NVN00240.1 MBL fold metallo-hydrolase [Arthrobacter sp. SDTb3-6]
MSTSSPKGMTVRTLGTGGGPIVSSGRAGTSTAITVDGATYVVDCGMGSIRNYRNECRWDGLRGIFLTHQHSDHIYDLGSFLVTGWEVPGESFSRPVHVFGPGRPSRPPALDEEQSRAIAARLGGRRMSGTVEMVDALLDTVFASDVAVRMADEGRGDPHAWITAHDIAIPDAANADPVTARHPHMEPFEIYRDELVVVTAILVDHRLCFPAFGFRFDSAYGSVVVSGDTAYSENCIRLAEGADLLLHEVIDLEAIVATFPDGPARAGIIEHLKESHTPYGQVGLVARAAGVGALVLHHIVPNTPGAADLAKMLLAVRADFAGQVSIAEDNDMFPVGADFTTISRLTMKTGAMP